MSIKFLKVFQVDKFFFKGDNYENPNFRKFESFIPVKSISKICDLLDWSKNYNIEDLKNTVDHENISVVIVKKTIYFCEIKCDELLLFLAK